MASQRNDTSHFSPWWSIAVALLFLLGCQGSTKSDPCGVVGDWHTHCESIGAAGCDQCSFDDTDHAFTISPDIAAKGGTWQGEDAPYTFDVATCTLSNSFDSTNPCVSSTRTYSRILSASGGHFQEKCFCYDTDTDTCNCIQPYACVDSRAGSQTGGTSGSNGGTGGSVSGGSATTVSGDTTSTGGTTSSGGASGGGTDGSASTDGCTETQAIQAARISLAAGSASVFVDCAQTLKYTRTLGSDGSLATEEIDDTVHGDMAVWDFRSPTRTYRAYPSRAATVAAHSMDVTLVPTEGDPATDVAATFISTDDTTGNNIPDQRVTWVVDTSSPTVSITVETDPTESGSWSVVYTGTEPRLQQSLMVDPTPPPVGCTADDAKALTDTFDPLINAGAACLKAMDSDLGKKFYEFFVDDNNVTVSCGTQTGFCGESDLAGAIYHWFPGDAPGQLSITIAPNGFADPAHCGALSSTLFHELMHFFLGPHKIGDGMPDPGDRIYNCEKTCFSPSEANSQTCAACLGSKNGDSRCNAYPQAPCDGSAPPAYCPCGDGNWYADSISCAVGCGSGLACFAVQCQTTNGPCQLGPLQ